MELQINKCGVIMVIKSLKTRFFSGLLACLFLMPVVSTLHADPTEEVAKTIPVRDIVQSIPVNWQAVATAWRGTGESAQQCLKAGCKAFHNILISGIGYKVLEISGDMATATCKCGTAWFEFFQKHPALLGVPLLCTATYSGYHKIRHGTWW
jgi:hypothetical protein